MKVSKVELLSYHLESSKQHSQIIITCKNPTKVATPQPKRVESGSTNTIWQMSTTRNRRCLEACCCCCCPLVTLVVEVTVTAKRSELSATERVKAKIRASRISSVTDSLKGPPSQSSAAPTYRSLLLIFALQEPSIVIQIHGCEFLKFAFF